MKNKIFANWNFLRIIRLTLGVMIIFQGFETKNASYSLLGGIFSAMAIVNIGCCSTSGSCNVNATKSNIKGKEETSFEEIK
jgi:hypothetical protein